jgi:hypothetical protein
MSIQHHFNRTRIAPLTVATNFKINNDSRRNKSRAPISKIVSIAFDCSINKISTLSSYRYTFVQRFEIRDHRSAVKDKSQSSKVSYKNTSDHRQIRRSKYDDLWWIAKRHIRSVSTHMCVYTYVHTWNICRTQFYWKPYSASREKAALLVGDSSDKIAYRKEHLFPIYFLNQQRSNELPSIHRITNTRWACFDRTRNIWKDTLDDAQWWEPINNLLIQFWYLISRNVNENTKLLEHEQTF